MHLLCCSTRRDMNIRTLSNSFGCDAAIFSVEVYGFQICSAAWLPRSHGTHVGQAVSSNSCSQKFFVARSQDGAAEHSFKLEAVVPKPTLCPFAKS